ncbi:MAG: substrate-binding domain-containing protein [Oscillospiraceae bacterium]|nr:substrate-binding domain-containing protein [Oscillospiraceae bacterium]
MFSVSRQTVRQAINILINEGVLESRQGSGTYICAPVSAKRVQSKTIGVIVTYFDEYIFPSIINGIESVISERGYTMHVACTRNDKDKEAAALRSMIANNIDGLIVEPTKSALPNGNHDIYREIAEKEIPLIFANSYYPDLRFPYVSLDDVKAGYVAAKCLMEMGHRKIAMILKSDDIQGHLRFRGARDAAGEMEIVLSQENTLWFTTEDIRYLEEESARVLRYIGDCTAVLCYNDQTAATVLRVLEKAGRNVPQDVSVISIDDANQATACTPKLTTVAHPKKLMGSIIAENLFRLIDGEKFDATYRFAPEIVIRDSVKNTR